MAGLFLLPASLQAAQLLYEGFDYPQPGIVTGKNGGYGWRGIWTTVDGNSADLAAGSLVTAANSPTGFDAEDRTGTILRARRHLLTTHLLRMIVHGCHAVGTCRSLRRAPRTAGGVREDSRIGYPPRRSPTKVDCQVKGPRERPPP